MIPPIFLGRVPVECAVPPRPSPAPRIGLGTAAPTPRTRPLAPPRQGAHPRNPARESDPAGGRTSPRRIRPPNREGYSVGGGAGAGVSLWARLLVWWQFPRGRRRVHSGALLLGPLKFRWTTVFRESGGPTELKWSNRTQVVQADQPRHDMRDAVPPCETIGGAEQGRGAGPPPHRPGRPGPGAWRPARAGPPRRAAGRRWGGARPPPPPPGRPAPGS